MWSNTLESERPENERLRNEARNETGNEDRNEAWNEARNEAGNEARNEARNEAKNEAGNEARNEAGNEAGNEARNEARNETRRDWEWGTAHPLFTREGWLVPLIQRDPQDVTWSHTHWRDLFADVEITTRAQLSRVKQYLAIQLTGRL